MMTYSIIITLMLVCVGVVMLGALAAIYIVSKILADKVVRRAKK